MISAKSVTFDKKYSYLESWFAIRVEDIFKIVKRACSIKRDPTEKIWKIVNRAALLIGSQEYATFSKHNGVILKKPSQYIGLSKTSVMQCISYVTATPQSDANSIYYSQLKFFFQFYIIAVLFCIVFYKQ